MSKDRFSVQSPQYAQYRPVYPDALFDELASLSLARNLAWDCACGTGQASLSMAARYKRVVATDLSAAQLASASTSDNLDYVAALAEAAPLAGESVDLVVVGQALHWFDIEAFFVECRRVLKPGGLLAVLTYNLLSVSPAVDKLIRHLYQEILGAYWDPERKLVEEGYASVEFPFQPLAVSGYAMECHWTCEHLMGYLSTWSAAKRYRADKGSDPLEAVADRLVAAWPGDQVLVRWPLTTIVRQKK